MLLSPLGIPSGVIKSSGFVPGGFHVLPPSSERWMICPNQPLVCDAKMRFGSAGDPLRWYISQPAKCGPLTSQFCRLPSAVRMNAPFFVPTNNRILLICSPSSLCVEWFFSAFPWRHTLADHSPTFSPLRNLPAQDSVPSLKYSLTTPFVS